MPDLSFLGPTAGVVIVVIYFLRAQSRESDIRKEEREEDRRVQYRLIKSIDTNTAATSVLISQGKEQHEFMKSLNGSLRKVVKHKQQQAKE